MKIYDVSVDDYAEYSRAGNLPAVDRSDYDSDYMSGPCCSSEEHLHFTGKDGASVRIVNGDLYVPKGMKRLKAKEKLERTEDLSGEGYYASSTSMRDPDPIIPGNHVDMTQIIFDKTAELKVANSGSEVQIDGQSMSPLKGLVHLVTKRGFSEEASRLMLKEAEKKRVAKFRVKYADHYGGYQQGYELQRSAPGSPGFQEPPPYSEMGLDSGYQAYGPYEDRQQVPMPTNDPSIYDPRVMPDPNAMQSALNMSQTGQKEIFDASMMGSLLGQMRDDTMIDEHLPELMSALDRLGRILFSFYWHGEEFQDRFGKQDMPDMESGLRNTFESLGDIIMGLKQKSIDPFPSEVHADLTDAAR